MSTTSVLVLGAGELGLEVVQSLAAHPARDKAKVVVLKRSAAASEEVEHFKRMGVEVHQGNVVDLSMEQIAELFRPYHTVVSCNGMTLPPEAQPKLAQAALEAKIKRYFPWQFGVDYDVIGRKSSQNLFDAQLDVRELLRGQSEVGWVIMSTGMFTSFLFEPAFGIVDANRSTVLALGSWKNRITTTSPKDIGRCTAELVFACPQVRGVVFVAGDTISMQSLADTVDAVLDRKVQRQLATIEQLEEDLASDPENGMKKYRAVFAHGIGVAWDKSVTFNAERGIAMETVADWARAHLSS